MSEQITDPRLAAARDLRDAHSLHSDAAQRVLTDLITYAEQRLAINVGLIQENGTLRDKARKGAAPADTTAESIAQMREVMQSFLAALDVTS